MGVRTISWTAYATYPSLRRLLLRAEPAQGPLYPALAVVAEVGVEPPHELLGRDARPVPVVEELVLEAAEEALARGIVRAAALRGHAPGEPVLLADPYPLGPAVVPAAVRVDGRAGALAPLRQGLEQGGIPAQIPW